MGKNEIIHVKNKKMPHHIPAVNVNNGFYQNIIFHFLYSKTEEKTRISIK